jgi:hypothetical protein
MNIAIVSKFNFHYECIGFLCEVLKEHAISVYFHGDHYGYIEYFRKLFPNIIHIESSIPLNNTIINSFDLVIKLSSNDNVVVDKKVVSILHLPNLKDISEKYISLTNFIKGSDIINVFPTYRVPNLITKFGNIITFIGFFQDNWCDDDFNRFIRNSKYQFNFIVWASPSYPSLRSHPNIKVLERVDTNTLTSIISNSTFILSRKPPHINYDRFCGCFTLATAFKKPLIVDKKTMETYGFPGIVFEKDYSEVIERLNTFTEEEYISLVNQVEEFRDISIKENKEKIDNLLTPFK